VDGASFAAVAIGGVIAAVLVWWFASRDLGRKDDAGRSSDRDRTR
jgi:hypothetical protein